MNSLKNIHRERQVNAEADVRGPKDRLSRYLMLAIGVMLGLMAVGLMRWANRDHAFAKQFERRVRAEVPIGASEGFVQQWARQNVRFLAHRLVPPRIDSVQGRDVIDLAGQPRARVASLLRVTVPRADLVSKIQEDTLRTYFFFDASGELIGYYFQTFRDVAQMEETGATE